LGEAMARQHLTGGTTIGVLFRQMEAAGRILCSPRRWANAGWSRAAAGASNACGRHKRWRVARWDQCIRGAWRALPTPLCPAAVRWRGAGCRCRAGLSRHRVHGKL
jgi:hypothetical protein